MNNQTNKLLQDIQQAVVCFYISDLHAVKFDVHSQEAISNIPEDRYPLQAWNESVSYILGKTCQFESIEEAKHHLCQYK